MTTELTVTERAANVLAFDETKTKLVALAAESARIVEITGAPGYQEAQAARVKLKFARVDIEKRGKAAREDAQAFAKAVIGKERELVEIIAPEEDRLQTLQDKWDAAIALEKAAKAEAERLRVLNIRLAIDTVRGLALLAVGATSEQIAELIERAKAPFDIDAQEFDVEAKRAQQEAVDRLTAAHAAAVAEEQRREEFRIAKELEDRRIAEERAELARLRAEQESRAAEERARLTAEREAEEKRQLDALLARIQADNKAAEEREAIAAAERAKQDEELRLQRAAEDQARRERLAAEEADRKEREAKEAAERAERERVAAEAAERQRIEAERIQREREHLEQAKAEQERIARQREIDSATLYDAAIEAHALLTRLAPTSITTAKLGAALSRHAEPEALKAAA